MGSLTYPRGRLPRRVYWVRRGIVLGVAFLLVFGIGKVLGGNGRDDTAGSAVTANNSSARQGSAASAAIGPVAPSTKIRAKDKAPLLPPNGDCVDEEVSVLPSVTRAWAGQPITIQLELQGTQPACTFDVSPESMVVKVVSGEDKIWSSQDCPRSIPTTQVVVRSGQPVQVPVTWSGRRSDDQCTNQPAWALPGFYHVYAAALGSTPTDVQFEVTRAATRFVTRTPTPHPSTSASATPRKPASATSPRANATPAAKPTSKPGSKASRKP